MLDRLRQHQNRRSDQSLGWPSAEQIGQESSRNFRVPASFVVERQSEESIGREGRRAGKRAGEGLLRGAVFTQHLEEMAPEVVESEREYGVTVLRDARVDDFQGFRKPTFEPVLDDLRARVFQRGQHE